MNSIFKVDQNSDDDIIYLNLSMNNAKKVSVPAQINITLPADLLDSSYMYRTSIDRFSINGSSIPIRLFKDDYFYISMQYGSTLISLPVIYSSVPSVGSNNQFYDKPIFSYQELAVLINQCMESVFLALQLTIGGPLVGASSPIFKFNVENGKYEIYAEKLYFDDLSAGTITMYFNNALFNLFQNFLIEFISENNQSEPHKDCRIVIRDMGLGLNEVVIGGKTYLKMSQEYSNPNSINGPQQLSIVSNNIGVKSEYIISGSDNVNSLTNTNFGTIPISNVIADFCPSFDSLQGWTGQIVYLPSYRRVHLRKILPSSRNFDLNVLWSDNAGRSYLFYLEPGKSMSIKFVFEKIKN